MNALKLNVLRKKAKLKPNSIKFIYLPRHHKSRIDRKKILEKVKKSAFEGRNIIEELEAFAFHIIKLKGFETNIFAG